MKAGSDQQGASWNDSELHRLAELHGTPYFLYDADAVCARIEEVRSAMEGLVGVYYAVKANPNLELLRSVRSAADGLDISSVGELGQGLAAGYGAGALSFAGPGKSTAELARAIETGIGSISVESLREVDECVAIAKAANRVANIVLRVNPSWLNRSFGLKMGGRPIQFGIDEEELPSAAQVIASGAPFLRFRGIHIYAGSQCFEAEGVIEGVRDALRIVEKFESETGLACTLVNLGGGFGVSPGPDDRRLDVHVLGRHLVPILREFRSASSIERAIVFELGRFLTTEAGIYVTRVISSKYSRGKSFFIVDGGLHHHLAAAGTFGAALRSNFPLRNLNRPDGPVVKCSIAGPSCNPTDLLGVDVDLVRPEAGDLVAVLKSGAYGFTASPLLFLGRPTAVELVRFRGQTVLARRSRTILDFNG